LDRAVVLDEVLNLQNGISHVSANV
jgi:hypothetical protein